VTVATRAADRDVALRNVSLGVAFVVLGLLAATAAAALSGAAASSPIADPGPVVRWGLVLVRVLADVAAALTIGTLVLAAIALPVVKPGLAHRPALLIATVAATVWAVAEVALLVLTFADVLGSPLTGPEIGTQLTGFARDVDLGRELALTAAAAAVIGLLAAGATRIRSAGLLAVAAMAALVPSALSGHASSSASHETAVTSLGLHLLGATIWTGGLAALVILGPGLTPSASRAATKRYSALALGCFVAVAGSGLINAWLRIGGFAGLNSDYGVLIAGKAAALLVLGGFGYWHRQRTLPALERGRRMMFARLAGVELLVMAVAFGLAAALSRTAPPAAGAPTTDLTESLTGYPMPPAPTVWSWFTAWQPDLMWLVLVGLAAVGYLSAAGRLHWRGDHWPVLRTVPFLIGLAALVYVTCGWPAMYGRVTFSGHMILHMALSMIVPPLLVLGAPVTLSLRVLSARQDGTRGAREWILAFVGSPFLKVISFAPVAAVLFAGSLVAFYYSGLFGLALTTHVGHELMHVHFLLVGYLFAWVLIGIDPGPARPGYPLRLMLLFATMAFHAFFFLAIMNGDTVLQLHFFEALHRPWGLPLLADQRYGGGIGWGIGEVPTLLIALVLAVQWASSDDRDARRYDRAADRDGDAELAAYNEMLARLAERDRTRG
jgi:cytochrome c oxidase assembly factor CtaG/putative copper export protein